MILGGQWQPPLLKFEFFGSNELWLAVVVSTRRKMQGRVHVI
jgi:hypothetical protein